MSPKNAPMLRAEGVCFSWPGHPVLQGFDLAVERGQVVCLMGVNGCGKSTFLDCILGENKPSSGLVRVDGQDVLGMRAAERARLVSYVPQIHERTFPFTVEHVVLMGRTAHQSGLGSVDDEDVQLACAALATCGVLHLRNRSCTTLSGGEMQMVLLARALAQDAPLIVLDEPTAHLDFRNEMVFLETVVQLAQDRGISVLMATHSLNQAFYLGAAGLDVRVALMVQGRTAAFGPPDEVLTPEAMRSCFGVVAAVAEVRSDGFVSEGDSARFCMRQIVPMGTNGLLERLQSKAKG